MGLLRAPACGHLRADTYVRHAEGQGEAGNWHECRRFDPAEGQRRYLEEVCVTKAYGFGPVQLVYHWAEGEDAPWRLVTSLEAGFKAVRHYRRRMGIEELFGDLQGSGFHLSQSRIWRPDRLSRLVLGVSLVYVWLVQCHV